MGPIAADLLTVGNTVASTSRGLITDSLTTMVSMMHAVPIRSSSAVPGSVATGGGVPAAHIAADAAAMYEAVAVDGVDFLLSIEG